MQAKKIFAALLACALAAALCAPGLAASEEIYINGERVPGGLGGLFAAGGGGISPLGGEAYVMTGSGLVKLGGEGEELPEPSGEPGHMEISGAIELDYDRIRVALYYYGEESSIRNHTLEYANLENGVGGGYDFGYYDDEREFHALGGTSETQITMSMDTNVLVPGGSLGCYHILLPGEYDSFDAAAEAAGAYGGFPACYNGRFYALCGDYESAAEAASAMAASGIDGQVYTASNRCVVVTRTADAKILFEFDFGTERNLAVMPRSSSAEALTWFKGYTYRGGFEYVRRDGGELTVINVVDIEDYVKGVLPYEMNDSWPLEALKAQAMCARTYAASHFNSLPGYQADVTNDTFSQVYRGTNASGAGTDAAVEATAGLYICYDGELIEAMYCSSNGGATENSENVMYSAVPYLRGRADPYEAAADDVNPYSSWSKTVSGSQLASGAVRYGHSLSTVASLETELSESGNVIGLTLTDPNGRSAHISGNECYEFCTSVLGLNSIHFEVEQSGTSFVFSGSGWGHSLGMSQYGAYAMAEAYGFSYDQIINFYFAGVELRRGA